MLRRIYQPDIGIDLGTSKFSLCTRSEGLLISEPAYIALRGTFDRPEIVAVGSEAAAMLGKGPPSIEICSPMREGVIERPYLASLLLKELARKVGIRRLFSGRRRMLVGTILGANPIEAKVFSEVASTLGASEIKLVKEPLAAAIGHTMGFDEPFGQLLVDVGSGVTEAIVFGMRRIIAGRSLRGGGTAMDEAIVEAIYRRYGVRVPLVAARSVKEELSSSTQKTFEVPGIDRSKGLPRLLTVTRGELLEVLEKPIGQIVMMVQELLSELAPDLSADLIASGIVLCGGGAYTATLRERLAAGTQLEVRIGDHPKDAVVRGCHSILKYVDLVN